MYNYLINELLPPQTYFLFVGQLVGGHLRALYSVSRKTDRHTRLTRLLTDESLTWIKPVDGVKSCCTDHYSYH